MSYTNAVFYMDYVNGSDAARTTLSGVVFDNPSGTTVRGTKVGHGLITGAVITVSGCTQAYANTAWKITRVDDDTFTLDGALWASFTGADVTGDAVPFGGMSWADAWKTITSGATAARIAPGDTVRIAKSPAPTSLGQSATWSTVPSTLTGNALPTAVTITSSTNATPIVITKNSHGLSNGEVVKVINHTTNTNANGVWVVANVTDNTFELEGSVGNGVGGATGTFQNVSRCCVVLTTGVTLTICNCESNWTAGTNVTSANTDATEYKQYLKSIKIITAAGHVGAGIISKFGLPSSLDLSGYRQVSFWFRNETSALATAGDMKLKLYSDSGCTTEVESFDLPAIPSTTAWICLTIDKGSALSATVQGVALYANIAMASKTFYIDGIIACKDSTSVDSLSLQSLISKNSLEQGGDEGWFGIQSIDGRIIVLDNQVDRSPFESGHLGYIGTPETVALYKRETIKTDLASASNTVVQAVQDSGTSGNIISFEGGYNITNSSCDGETYFDGRNGRGYGVAVSTKTYWSITKLNAVRYGIGIYVDSYCIPGTLEISNASNNTSYGLNVSTSGVSGTLNIDLTLRNGNMNGSNGVTISGSPINFVYVANINSNGGYGISLGSIYCAGTTIKKCNGNSSMGINISSITVDAVIDLIQEVNHNGSSLTIGGYRCLIKEVSDISYNGSNGVSFSGYGNRITNAPSIQYNSIYGIIMTSAAAGDNHIMTGETTGNASGSISIASTCIGYLHLHNFKMNEATKVVVATSDIDSRVFSTNHDKDADTHYIWSCLGTLNSQNTVRYTESGIAWLIQPSSVATTLRPFNVPLFKAACEANKLVTVACRMRRSDTKLTLGLFCKGSQLTGATLSSDIDVPMTAAIDTWENVTFTFTPTIKGVIEVEVKAFRNDSGGTYLGYFDDVTISQAA